MLFRSCRPTSCCLHHLLEVWPPEPAGPPWQKLFLHQAKLDSIEVSEAEIIQRVDMMTNMYIQQIGSREKMEEYFNKTSTQIRETLRDNARDGLTVQKMQQKLAGDIKVTPAEVRRYFKDLPQDSIPYIPTQEIGRAHV